MKHVDSFFPKKPCLSVFFLICGLIISNSSFSQIVEIGTGTTTNGIAESAPVNINNRRSVSYIVYTVAELTAGGAIGSGEINELGFYVTNKPIYNIPDYEIQIKHTTAANASGVATGGFTTVKTIGSYEPTSGGWDMLDLDTPFNWNGTQNIVVRICWSAVSPGSNASGQVRINTATNGYRYFGGLFPFGSGCALTPALNANYKPHIRLVFQDETVWTGLVNTNWANAGNWTAGVPTKDMDALIPSGVPNNPTLTGFGYCRTLQQNGSLTIGSGAKLSINDDFINTGTFVDLGGELAFESNVAHDLNSTSQLTINTLHSNSFNGFTITNRSVRIKNELKITKGVVNTSDSLFIVSDADKTGRIDEIKTVCSFTIEMEDSYEDGWNGGFVSIFEDGVLVDEFSCENDASTGSFQIVAGRTMTVEYTAGSYENENYYRILNADGEELFEDGTTPDEGEVYSLLVEGCEYSDGIIGDIVMERYIDAGETYWRYFASAVENPTISQYMDDFTTAGFEGSPFPDFPFNSIAWYDETQGPGEGYIPCESADEIITVGKGYHVWSGDTITGTEPFIVDLVGPANQGDISIPVTYTFSDTPSEDGWNLIGNPYASTINWDANAWTKVNMANAIYIQDPDTKLFAAYVAGAGVNGGTKYVASQQSFWVLATADDPALTIREGAKSNVDAVFYAVEDLSAGMNVQLTGFEKMDEAVIRHVEGATLALEHAYDAQDLFGGWGVQPQISFVNPEEKDLAIHSFDKGNETWEIPMRVIVFETGTYEITFNQVFEMGVPCMVLEDIYTGDMYHVEEGTALSFLVSDTTYAPRFILHIGRNYDLIKQAVQCNNGSDGEVLIDLGVDSVTYNLISGFGMEYNTVAGNPLLIEGLSSGAYVLELEGFEDLCATDDFAFTISQPSELKVFATVSDVISGSDGQIILDVEGGISPYSYEWNTGATAPILSDLEEGVYSVAILDAHECALDTVFIVGKELSDVSVEEELALNISGYYYGSNNQYIIENGDSEFITSILLYDTEGRILSEYVVNSDLNRIVIDLPNGLAAGIYLFALVDNSIVLKFGLN